MINTEYKSFTALRNPIHKTFFLLWIMGLSSLFVCAYFMSEEITGLSFSVGSAQAGMISFLMCTLTLVSCYGAWIYLTFNYRVVEYIDLFEKDLAEEKLNVIRSARALSLGKMAAGIAHEINNPLAIINTKVRRIKKLWDAEIKNPKEDIDRHLDPIIKQVNRIAYIIKALRNLTGDESEEKTKVCSLQQIIRNSHEYVETLLKEREIWFEYDDFDKDYYVNCRSTELSQVFYNLFSNSIDAIKDLPDRWIKVSIIADEKNLLIRFADSGGPLEGEHVEKLMDPFYTTKEVGKGSGLGLSISYSIAKSHGGILQYDYKARTTTFLLTLPRVRENTKAS